MSASANFLFGYLPTLKMEAKYSSEMKNLTKETVFLTLNACCEVLTAMIAIITFFCSMAP
jgi:hypothetical protein